MATPRHRHSRRRRISLWMPLGAAAALLGVTFLIVSLTKNPLSAPDAQTPDGTPSATAGTTAATTAAAPTTTATAAPTIPDSGEDGYWSNNLYIWNNAAYEIFYGGESGARYYAEVVSGLKAYLPQQRVYNMVVPNHSEFGLPDRVKADAGGASQRDRTALIYRSYTAAIEPVDISGVMDAHKNEYLYYNTDTHWASLGAYYAYTKFCDVAGVTALPIEQMEKETVDDDFTGYLYLITEEPCLAAHPDHIDLYEPPVNYTAYLTDDNGDFYEVSGVNSPYVSSGYSMFAWGDQACMRVVNHDGHTGRKVLIVKDSYGNAMVPFLVSSFDETHVVDFRHFTRNLASYCEEHGITDVLFFNNVMSAYSQPDRLTELFD